MKADMDISIAIIDGKGLLRFGDNIVHCAVVNVIVTRDTDFATLLENARITLELIATPEDVK